MATELARPRRRFRAMRAEELPGVTVVAARDRDRVALLRGSLDEGEAEAIVLAIELRADVLLMDELDGRRIAVEQGLATTGVLGVLVRAKAGRLIPELAPLAIRLRDELGFHLSDAVLDEARRLAGET